VDFDHTGLTGGAHGLIGRMRPANFGCEQYYKKSNIINRQTVDNNNICFGTTLKL
jgi:hypothetical protein